MKYLLTDAPGVIDMHTSKRPVEAGYEFVGLDKLNSYYSMAMKDRKLPERNKAYQACSG